MDLARIKKFTFIINSVILFLVIALAGFFYLCRATILLWFSKADDNLYTGKKTGKNKVVY